MTGNELPILHYVSGERNQCLAVQQAIVLEAQFHIVGNASFHAYDALLDIRKAGAPFAIDKVLPIAYRRRHEQEIGL